MSNVIRRSEFPTRSCTAAYPATPRRMNLDLTAEVYAVHSCRGDEANCGYPTALGEFMCHLIPLRDCRQHDVTSHLNAHAVGVPLGLQPPDLLERLCTKPAPELRQSKQGPNDQSAHRRPPKRCARFVAHYDVGGLGTVPWRVTAHAAKRSVMPMSVCLGQHVRHAAFRSREARC